MEIMLRALLILLIAKTVLATVCPSGAVEWNSNCYIFQTNATEFATAEISCQSIMNGNLVSIHDAFTNALLAGEAPNYFQQSTDSDFWVGGTLMMHAGNWSWMDNSIFDFNDWEKGEPKNISGSGCISVSISTGAWSSQDCFKSKPYVCQISAIPTNPPFINCTFGWAYFQPTGYCYGVGITNPGKLNWTAAEAYCESFNNGAHLVSIHSWDEYNFVETYDGYAWDGSFWTGLSSNDEGKTWTYTDKTYFDYQHKASCFDNSLRCVGCGSGGFCTYNCDEARRFLCKRKP